MYFYDYGVVCVENLSEFVLVLSVVSNCGLDRLIRIFGEQTQFPDHSWFVLPFCL